MKGTIWKHKDGGTYEVVSVRKDNFIGQMNLIYYTPSDIDKIIELKEKGKSHIFCRTEEHFKDSFEMVQIGNGV